MNQFLPDHNYLYTKAADVQVQTRHCCFLEAESLSLRVNSDLAQGLRWVLEEVAQGMLVNQTAPSPTVFGGGGGGFPLCNGGPRRDRLYRR